METAIVLIGMLLPIAAASVFYAGDQRMNRTQQSDATIATTPIVETATPESFGTESSVADSTSTETAPVETPSAGSAEGGTTTVTDAAEPELTA